MLAISFRATALAGVIVALGATRAFAAGSELPAGFGEFRIGESWSELERRHRFRELDSPATPWERFVHECGYRAVALETDKGELLVTVHDFVVTELAYVTPIESGSDPLAVADLVMQTYGQPERASMRDVLGKVTIDRDRVNFVTLEYEEPRPVTFTIAGRDLWQYRISVRHEQRRWHENKNTRCARDLEREARAPDPNPEPETEQTSAAPSDTAQ